VLNVPWVVGSGGGAYPYLEGWTGLIFATSGCSCAVLRCALFANDVRIWYMDYGHADASHKDIPNPYQSINQVPLPFHSVPITQTVQGNT